jgi:hypothetical protein
VEHVYIPKGFLGLEEEVFSAAPALYDQIAYVMRSTETLSFSMLQ